MTTDNIIDKLVSEGVIPSDMRELARKELLRELTRRTKRVSLLLALIAERQQLKWLSSYLPSGQFGALKDSRIF